MSNFVKNLIIFIICLFALISGLNAYTLNPTTENDKLVDEYFFTAMDKAKDVDYISALEYTKKIIEIIPNHPAGYLYQSAVLSWIVSDYYNYDYVDEFMGSIDKTIDLANDMIQSQRLNPWGYVYLGGAYGFRGIYYSGIGSFYYAFVDGVRGNYELGKSLELAPNIYDNYFGTGTFDFWRAYYAGKFFWLGGSEKSKQDGIDKVKLAIEKGKYTTLEAQFSLVRIYLVDERYQDAIDTSKALLEVSPNSIKVRKFMSIAYQKQGKYNEAIKILKELEGFLLSSPLKTPAVLLETQISLAKVYMDMGNNVKASLVLAGAKTYRNQIEAENNFLESLIDEYEGLINKINES